MKIRSVRFIGYKRFHDLQIDLGSQPRRIVALVGPNGCGKSCVFDGILFLNNAQYALGNTGNLDSRYHSLHGHPNYNFKNINLDFATGTYRTVWDRRRTSGTENTIFRSVAHIVIIRKSRFPKLEQ